MPTPLQGDAPRRVVGARAAGRRRGCDAPGVGAPAGRLAGAVPALR